MSNHCDYYLENTIYKIHLVKAQLDQQHIPKINLVLTNKYKEIIQT